MQTDLVLSAKLVGFLLTYQPGETNSSLSLCLLEWHGR